MAFSISFSFIAVDKFTHVGKKIRRTQVKIAQNMKKLGKVFKNVGSKISGFGRDLTAKMAVPTAGAILAFKEFEKGLANVNTLLDADDLKKYGESLAKVQQEAVRLGFDIGDASKALFDNVSALGISNRSLEDFRTAQKLAIGGVTELKTAVGGIAAVVNAYGSDVAKADEVANAFFSAQKKGTTTVGLLASNIGKVAPAAKNMGIGFKTLLASMAQLTQGGLSTDEATTALRATLTALRKPTGDAKKIFEALNIPFGTMGIRSAGLAKTLLAVAKAGREFPQALDLAIPNVRAFTGLMNFGAKEVARMQSIVELINKDIKNGTGLNDAYATQMATLNQKTKQLWGSLKDFGRGIVEQLKPIIIGIVEALTFWINKFNKLSPTTKKVIAKIFALVAVLGPLAIMIGGIIAAIGFLGTAFAFITAKISLVAGVVYALIAAFAALGIFWEEITTTIKSITTSVVDWVVGKFNAMINKVKEFIDLITFKTLDNFFADNIGDLTQAFEAIVTPGAPAATQNPLIQKNKNEFQGALNININDRNKNVQSVQVEKTKGSLDLGLTGVGF